MTPQAAQNTPAPLSEARPNLQIVSPPARLQVQSSGSFSSVRSKRAAVRDFRSTGVSQQPQAAPTLQAVIDDCVRHKRDFTLEYHAREDRFSVRGERVFDPGGTLWKAEGPPDREGQHGLLSTVVGPFRALVVRRADGWWLQIQGCAERWFLGTSTQAAALYKAVRVLKEQISVALRQVDINF